MKLTDAHMHISLLPHILLFDELAPVANLSLVQYPYLLDIKMRINTDSCKTRSDKNTKRVCVICVLIYNW